MPRRLRLKHKILESVAGELVDWLNATGGTYTVVGVLEAALRLDAASRSRSEQHTVSALLGQLNQRIPQARRVVSYVDKGRWIGRWEEPSALRKGLMRMGGPDNPPRTDVEWAMAILDMGEAGLLSRIRRCECGKWVMASSERQRFCSTACRQRAAAQTPKFKKRRREYMRDYYDKYLKAPRHRAAQSRTKKKPQ